MFIGGAAKGAIKSVSLHIINKVIAGERITPGGLYPLSFIADLYTINNCYLHCVNSLMSYVVILIINS